MCLKMISWGQKIEGKELRGEVRKILCFVNICVFGTNYTISDFLVLGTLHSGCDLVGPIVQ